MKINSLPVWRARVRPAFTLLEMVVAITVFTIFIGFALQTYLTFQRSDYEVLVERQLTFEGQGILDVLTEEIQRQRIDYSEYSSRGQVPLLTGSVLYLISADGAIETRFEWDALTQRLTKATRTPGGAWSKATPLHSATVQVSQVQFDIFPSDNPFDSANRLTDALQFQPVVSIGLTVQSPSRVRDVAELELQTSVATRLYQ